MDNTSRQNYQRLQILVYFLSEPNWPEDELGISKENAITLVATSLSLDRKDPEFISKAVLKIDGTLLEQNPPNIPEDLQKLVEDYEVYLLKKQEEDLKITFPTLDEQIEQQYQSYQESVLKELLKDKTFANNPLLAKVLSHQLSLRAIRQLPQVANVTAFETTVSPNNYQQIVFQSLPNLTTPGIVEQIAQATWSQAKTMATLRRIPALPSELPSKPLAPVTKVGFVLLHPSILVSFLKKLILSPIVKPLQIAIKILPIKIPPEVKMAIFKGLTSNDLQLTISNLLKDGLSLRHPEVIDLEKQKNSLKQFESGHPFLANILRNYHEFSKKLKFGLTTFPAEKYLTKIQPPIQQKLIQPVARWFKNNTAGKLTSFISNLGIFLKKLINKPDVSIFGGLGLMGFSLAPLPSPVKFTLFSTGAIFATGGFIGKAPQIVNKAITQVGKFFTNVSGKISIFLSSLTTTATSAANISSVGVIGGIGLIVVLGLIVITTAGSTLVPTEMGGSVPHVGTPVDPRCSETNLHLAEQVICVLKKCGITQVTPETWTNTKTCLGASSLPNKQLIIDEFNYSTNTVGNNPNEPKYYGLQCVGFVKGIMAALGKPLDKTGIHGAKDYLNPPPPTGYQLITSGLENVQIGDLVIMEGIVYGHIGIVVNITEKGIWVVQAWGESNGFVQITENNPAYYDGFLRPL